MRAHESRAKQGVEASRDEDAHEQHREMLVRTTSFGPGHGLVVRAARSLRIA